MFAKNVQRALLKMRKIFPPTPLQYSEFLSKRYQADIYLKREDLSPVRSYKIRGAFHYISDYLQKHKNKKITFVCSSLGNHAQGVAFACAQFKSKGIIFMPTTAPKQKIDKVKIIGKGYVEIKLEGDTFDDAARFSKKFCQQNKDNVYVAPYDKVEVIEGQATVAAEILEQSTKKIDLIFTPVGGGGLASGICKFFKENSPHTEIVFTEALGCPSFSESLKAGKAIELDKIDTFVDGAAVGIFGKNPFKILKPHVQREVILIPENRLCETIMEFLYHEGIVLEPAGGLSIDGLKSMKKSFLKNKNIVCVVSGGNFDFERLPEVKERAMNAAGLKKYFILRLPQRPGALKDFLSLLGPDDDIARFEYLKKSAKEFGSILLGIETKDPANFKVLTKKIAKQNFYFKDVTEDEVLADFLI